MKPDVIIEAACAEFGIVLEKTAREQLAKYEELLREWSVRVRLISKGDRMRIWERHILDCLSAVPRIPFGGRLLDLGSGAGLPGIPLAIALPHMPVYLLEPARMKALFLNQAISHLGIRNAVVIRDRAENLICNSDFSARISVVTARAVASLPQLWHHAQPLLEPSGCLLAMKGPDPLQEFGSGIPSDLQCDVEEIQLPITGRLRAFVTVRRILPH